jgi:hypothetical protein
MGPPYLAVRHRAAPSGAQTMLTMTKTALWQFRGLCSSIGALLSRDRQGAGRYSIRETCANKCGKRFERTRSNPKWHLARQFP